MLHVDVSYGYKLPLGSLARDFKPGMYGFAGPNGSGKSTLLLTIAGELAPISGEVVCAGERPIVRIGDPIFYPDLTVAEHLELLPVPFDQVVDSWQLGDLLPHPPIWLSSGQRQRVFLASQLSIPADVSIIDEPERHLDSDWTDFLAVELRELSGDRVVLVASHSPAILAACDEVIAL
ncbi:ATP-binding cassette domain-containing protein [Corynebacterium hindlerae]|uniref:ATP-binding cassette domain-containing protein n=1 Tax=Corynebacterium hindlerae TaxID=699041 RepID=A0A7G5FCP3_9CORY|nr:ATP-binding cassette domain-containing protein [Corynebacterium hindlerae]QMV84384.1 ATP-binding cassette domain-containing protein [Corynebacterium hindlerae]QTH59708.1 ATP-binding cassette domain-containing protein [Corynebacterium hindlerae]